MKDVLTHEQIMYILQRETIARLGCSANHQSYIVPISYAFDGKFIYGRSKEGQKIKMMRANPKVCVEIDRIESMANWQSVIIQGLYEEVAVPAEQSKILKIIKDKFTPLVTSKSLIPHGLDKSPAIVEKEKKAVVFRISIVKMSGRYEKPD